MVKLALMAVVCLLCSSAFADEPSPAERFATAQRSYAKRERDRASSDLSRARSELARARRGGGDVSGCKARMASAAGRIKTFTNFSGVPVLGELKVGEIGTLPTDNAKVYRIVQIRPEEIELIPEMEALGSSADNGRTFISRTIRMGPNFVLAADNLAGVGDDEDYYSPSGVFEVKSVRSGKAYLVPFDSDAIPKKK